MIGFSDQSSGTLRESLERLAVSALGAVALTADRVEELAERLSERGTISRDEARTLVQEAALRWRGDAVRLGERAGAGLEGLFRELGLVSRNELDELELRVAQLEHRLRLVEGMPPELPAPQH